MGCVIETAWGDVANGKRQEDCMYENFVILVAQGSVKMQGKKRGK